MRTPVNQRIYDLIKEAEKKSAGSPALTSAKVLDSLLQCLSASFYLTSIIWYKDVLDCFGQKATRRPFPADLTLVGCSCPCYLLSVVTLSVHKRVSLRRLQTKRNKQTPQTTREILNGGSVEDSCILRASPKRRVADAASRCHFYSENSMCKLWREAVAGRTRHDQGGIASVAASINATLC